MSNTDTTYRITNDEGREEAIITAASDREAITIHLAELGYAEGCEEWQELYEGLCAEEITDTTWLVEQFEEHVDVDDI